MKLIKLVIENFRGIQGTCEIKFDNSNIIFLIGQNNIGKSTFLHAYEYFVSAKTLAEKEDFFDFSSENTITITGVFEKENDDDTDIDLVGTGRSSEPDWINKWVDTANGNIVKVKKVWNQIGNTFNKFTWSIEDNDWVTNGFGGLHSKLTKYTPTPIFINAMETEDSLEKKVNKLIQDEFLKKISENEEFEDEYNEAIEKVKSLQERIIGTDAITEYNGQINEAFSRIFTDLVLKIEPKGDDKIKLEDAIKNSHSILVQKDGVDREEAISSHGHGVIRQALFNFLTFLKRNSNGTRKEYLILFEEPELFLHPKIAYKLRESLYELSENSPYQILCATHSPLMIDISKDHSSLVRVAKENGMVRTYQADSILFNGNDNERRDRVIMINRFNPHICESFYADKVILVEGDTETIVYRDLLKRFYPNEEIFVVNTGSKNNIPFFQDVLTHFRVEHYVIHDVDTRTSIRDGREITNSAWTLNERIWEKVENANNIKNGLSRRYVHQQNFEDAHVRLDPSLDFSGKDKPFKAYTFAQSIEQNSNADCILWLRDMVGNKEILHDQIYIEQF
ncbi:ATP-dependent endonuclease [Arcobacter sp. LA11]|uniref:ATP-dependent nuclease n=1 Tax=Arcobacter sp. LA11 TaxID=1898176 RepID=UPI000932620D|nr:AAA family ATPase [Arcobacter sp. LA11]